MLAVEHKLEQWFSNCELKTISISITWEQSEPGEGPSNVWFATSSWWFWGTLAFDNQLAGAGALAPGTVPPVHAAYKVLENFHQEGYWTDHLEFMGPINHCCWEI